MSIAGAGMSIAAGISGDGRPVVAGSGIIGAGAAIAAAVAPPTMPGAADGGVFAPSGAVWAQSAMTCAGIITVARSPPSPVWFNATWIPSE